MNRSELCESIESILGMQTDRSIVLTGFYLAPDQLLVVRPDLEPDDPQVGAVGRYRNVPVFRSDAGRAPGGRQDMVMTASHRGIAFTYVQLDVVN